MPHEEIGSFSWTIERQLRTMLATGFNPAHIEVLSAKAGDIAKRLAEFREQQMKARESGKYSREGLQEIEAELAAPIAGEIRRLTDDATLRQRLISAEKALQPEGQTDATERLLSYMKAMEIRSTLQAAGISAADPLKVELAFRDALTRQDWLTVTAITEWPLGSGLSPALVAEGQRARMSAVHPEGYKSYSDLKTFQTVLTQMRDDALRALPLATPDPIAEAAGQAS